MIGLAGSHQPPSLVRPGLVILRWLQVDVDARRAGQRFHLISRAALRIARGHNQSAQIHVTTRSVSCAVRCFAATASHTRIGEPIGD